MMMIQIYPSDNQRVMKRCIICNVPQELTEYYKHPQMHDGHLNKCKTCTKAQAKERHHNLFENDPKWVERERIRSREKHKRLGYSAIHHERVKGKRWVTAKYKNTRRDLKIPKHLQPHHWNYNEDFLRDVFVLDPLEHRKAHIGITLDEELLVFRTDDGELLDTREKHEAFLISKGLTLITHVR